MAKNRGGGNAVELSRELLIFSIVIFYGQSVIAVKIAIHGWNIVWS